LFQIRSGGYVGEGRSTESGGCRQPQPGDSVIALPRGDNLNFDFDFRTSVTNATAIAVVATIAVYVELTSLRPSRTTATSVWNVAAPKDELHKTRKQNEIADGLLPRTHLGGGSRELLVMVASCTLADEVAGSLRAGELEQAATTTGASTGVATA